VCCLTRPASPVARFCTHFAFHKMGFMDDAREASASLRKRASATLSSIPTFPTLGYGESVSRDESSDDDDDLLSANHSIPRARSSSASRSSARKKGSRTGEDRPVRPRSMDGPIARQERGREPFPLACVALSFGGDWSSAARSFPSVPRFPTLGLGGDEEGAKEGARRNKMPLAWAISDRLAAQVSGFSLLYSRIFATCMYYYYKPKINDYIQNCKQKNVCIYMYI